MKYQKNLYWRQRVKIIYMMEIKYCYVTDESDEFLEEMDPNIWMLDAMLDVFVKVFFIPFPL